MKLVAVILYYHLFLSIWMDFRVRNGNGREKNGALEVQSMDIKLYGVNAKYRKYN